MNLDRACARLTHTLLETPDTGGLLSSAVFALTEELQGHKVAIINPTTLSVLASSDPPSLVTRLPRGGALLDGEPATVVADPGGRDLAVVVSPPPADVEEIRSAISVVAAMVAHSRRVGQLSANEERLRMAQSMAGLGSYDWEIDTDTNTWSDELYRIYGTEPQSFNASYERFMSFIHPDDRERIQQVHAQAYESGEPYEMEERIVRPDGTVRTLKSNGIVLRDEAGKPVRMTGICWDITELKEAAASKAELLEAQEARRRSLEINDAIVQRLSLASNALEHGGLREGIRFVHESLMESRRIAGEMLEQASKHGADLRVLIRTEPAVPTSGARPDEMSGNENATRVLIADDTPGMRMLVREFLNPDSGFQVVGEAATGYEVLSLAQDLKPDLIVLDLSMPELDGMAAIPELRRLVPHSAILVMSGYGGPMVDRALAAGASSYVEKGPGFAELVERARQVVSMRKAV